MESTVKYMHCVMTKHIKFLSLCRMSSFSSSKKVDPRFKNPCEELQQFIEVPLFRKDEITFNPSIQVMKTAQRLFMPEESHEIKFLASVTDTEHFPQHNLPEVTFIGRNNVGKSSLLRCLFIKVPGLVVRTAKNPGQEPTVNFFQVGNSLCLVDMPGYGHRHPEGFLKAVESYLKTRQNLKRTFLLVDGKVGFQKWDEVALDMLEEFKVPYGLCGFGNMDIMAISSMGLAGDRVCSVTGEGICYLQAYIAHITGNLLLNEQ